MATVALEADGRRLSEAPDRLGRLAPTDPGLGTAALRGRLEADGYVWLKGLLPRDEVTAFRAWVFGRLAPTGLIVPGSDPALGLAAAEGVDRAAADRTLAELVRAAAYEGFCLHPRLVRLMDDLLGGPSTLLKRRLLRLTRPGTATATPAHYDLVYLRGGTTRVVTAWIPIGDTAVAEGGLAYLEGSHAAGAAMEAEFSRINAALPPEERISAYNRHMTEGGWVSKDLPALADRFGARWLVADYEAGDVVLHTPFTIHASTTNQSPGGRIRLSTDIRFQALSEAADPRWASPWAPDDGL